jgi:hypothetical protein
MTQVNKIKIRRGANASIPAANTEVGELRYSTDTKELYIDDGTTNVKIGGDPAGMPVSTAQQTALNLKANLASPTLTGTPAAPTASAATSTTQLATTAFVTTADNLKADLASPALTGISTAPTASTGTSTTQLATTAFTTSSVSALSATLTVVSDALTIMGVI